MRGRQHNSLSSFGLFEARSVGIAGDYKKFVCVAFWRFHVSAGSGSDLCVPHTIPVFQPDFVSGNVSIFPSQGKNEGRKAEFPSERKNSCKEKRQTKKVRMKKMNNGKKR